MFLAITRVWCRKSYPSVFEMTITPEWMYSTYQKRNWVEVFVKLKPKNG